MRAISCTSAAENRSAPETYEPYRRAGPRDAPLDDIVPVPAASCIDEVPEFGKPVDGMPVPMDVPGDSATVLPLPTMALIDW